MLCRKAQVKMSEENLPIPNSDGKDASASDARLQSLLERVCDQLVTAAELEELGTLLNANKEVREYYLKHLSLHSSLHNYGWPVPASCDSGSCGCEVDDIPPRRGRLR